MVAYGPWLLGGMSGITAGGSLLRELALPLVVGG